MDNKFYSTIKDYYDYIFPLNIQQVDFVKSEIPNKKSSVIEIGCANGKLTNALREYNIMGIDLESDFIDTAISRYPDIEFKALNMLAISTLNKKFDGIICFGNTLVHLTMEEINQFILECKNALNKNGKLLIQILNYNNIIDNNIKTLPVIDNEQVKFVRQYRFSDRLIFDTTLTVKSAGETISNSINLTPIRKDELISILDKADFKEINLYGSFAKNELQDNSLPVIISCVKG